MDDEMVERKERVLRVLKAEMPEDLKTKAAEVGNQALDAHEVEKDVAQFVKKAFDEASPGTWHCVVGRNFGCSITHETKYLIFFKLDQVFFMLFKSQE
mmetsp:Transcript_3682/g.10578  ORF Transcript_3682/g.10578 Transcript_3682/m.10578 type:complete len:98 (+) Transcript_3682:170-463(+)|eukprot:CAMPEP_0118855508 /NCGR_PEP_ID=MMETSP1163-20130328/3309_1 /TAXON_ID=124430 /ORGANISM="Phaeomonas parva, Strain CCMP2877" /LENGTH=97 /DNA_ID=CAMNT_0006788407 /DNA_START=170 /DNA_END=463 /DNA_ORIENTATION=-